MNKRIILRFLAVSAFALGLPIASFAQGSGHEPGRCGPQEMHGGEMHQKHGMPKLPGIDLSAAQVSQLKSLREQERKQFSETKTVMRAQHDALRKLTMSDAYTPAAAAEIISKIGAIQMDMAKLRAEHGNKFYKLLTPEQRTKLQQKRIHRKSVEE